MSEGPGGPQGATAGGTLAMRMLSQQAMVASQMKRAANDKAIAQMLASKKSGPPAACKMASESIAVWHSNRS